MGKLHAVIAVERPLVTTAQQLVAEASTTFSGKPDRFLGAVRNVEYFDTARASENVTDTKEVVTTVDEKLHHVLPALVRAWDATYQKEVANTVAKADLVYEGKVLLANCPAPFLLGLEKRLETLRGLINQIPTLDPNFQWFASGDSQRAGISRSQTITTQRTEKRADVLVLAPATDKHPAQVKEITTDRSVARIDTTTFSGMWSVSRKAQVLDRISNLILAVKQARADANNTEAPNVEFANKIMSVLFA